MRTSWFLLPPCLLALLACRDHRADGPPAASAPSVTAVAPAEPPVACDRTISIEQTTPLEQTLADSWFVALGCDGPDARPHLRFNGKDLPHEQPEVPRDQWVATWRAIDALDWHTLGEEDCGARDGEAPGWELSLKVEITVGTESRELECGELARGRRFVALLAIMDELTESWRGKGTSVAPDLAVIATGHGGGIALGTPTDGARERLRRYQGVTLKQASEPYGEGEELAVTHVMVRGDHQLTFSVNEMDDTIEELFVDGGLPRLSGPRGALLGLGTRARELAHRYGAPAQFEEGGDGGPACASFAAARGIWFCFRDEQRWDEVLAADRAVRRVSIREP